VEGPFFNAESLSRYLGIHKKQVYRLLKRGVLPGSQATGKWLFKKDEIDAWVERGKSTGPTPRHDGPVLIAGEDDPLLELLCEIGEAHHGFTAGRIPASMDRALALAASDAAPMATFELTRGACRWKWPPEVTERFAADRWSVLHLGRREMGLARRPGAKKRPLESLGGAKIGLRPSGTASRTLLEHRLLRADLDPDALFAVQPVYPSHQELIRALLVGEIDVALVPHHQATRYGLASDPIAPLDLELLVANDQLERLAPLIDALASRTLKDRTRAWAGLSLKKHAELEPLSA
jgi:putative molybdopterin biosynthesis protein